MGKVVVLGSINQDVIAVTERHPLPGETVMGSKLLHLPGGKGANESVASACTGAQSMLLGAIGADASGASLLSFLKSRGVDVTRVRSEGDVPTGTALIAVDSKGENSIIVISGANDRVQDDADVMLSPGDVLLSQFEVPRESIGAFFERGRSSDCTTILNPSPAASIPSEILALTDVLIVNEVELEALIKADIDRADRNELIRRATSLLPGGTVVVTLGGERVVASGVMGSIDLAGERVDAIDTTGAGDCFVGSLAGCLALGTRFVDAIRYANRAASICVTREGAATSIPVRSEVVDSVA